MTSPILQILHGVLYGKGIRFGKLSGTARLIATMAGKNADVIPVSNSQIHDHAMTIAKVPAAKFYTDAKLLVDAEFAVNRWYGIDRFMITTDLYDLEVEALGGKLVSSPNAMPNVDTTQPLIKKPGDLDKLGPLDISKGRIPMGVEIARLTLKKDPGPLTYGQFCSPWSFICQAMGYPKAVRALRRDKAFALELFDYAENQVLFPYIKAMRDVGVTYAAGPDAWASFPNLTVEMIEEWVLPSAIRMKERGKQEFKMKVEAGIGAADYTEEDPGKFDKERMFKAMAMAGKFFANDVAFMMQGPTHLFDMRWVQEYAETKGKGKKIPMIIGINGRFIRDATPVQIINKLMEWIDIMGRDGRFAVMFANVPVDTNPLNIHTVMHTLHTLGRYPIAADLSSVKMGTPTFQPFDKWLKGQPEEETILKAREGG